MVGVYHHCNKCRTNTYYNRKHNVLVCAICKTEIKYGT